MIKMLPWVAETANKEEDNNLMISHVLKDLKDLEAGAASLLVGGDTLVYASLDENGEYYVYECTIRRTSPNLALIYDPNQFKYSTDGSVN